MKIERLLKIIILLLEKKVISASSLAKTLEVTKRTIYRDMETLEYAGFPIISYPGKDGGYALLESFKLHAFTFTPEDKQHIQEALTIKQELLPSSNNLSTIKEKIELLENTNTTNTLSFISPTLHNPSIEAKTKEKLELIKEVLVQQKKIRITYISNTGNYSTRIICPILLKLEDGSWYLEAYCDTRRDYRVFKITRIKEMEVIAITFDKTSFPLPNKKIDQTEQITLQFSKYTIGKLLDFYPEEIMIHKENYIEVTFQHSINKNLIPFLMMFGNQVKVIKPKSLKQKHHDYIKNMQTIYTNTDIQ